MKHGRKRSALLLSCFGALALFAIPSGFTPMRSQEAANQEAPLLAGAPAPQSSTVPLGIGATAVGVATLAASRRRV